MDEKIVARVTEILLDKYILKVDNKSSINTFNCNNTFEAYKTGNVKKNNNILVGDLVNVKKSYDKYMIEKVLLRKNQVIRPPVANIDQMVIVLSIKNPLPDYMLLDKQLVLCKSKNIEPVICINKIDLCNDFEYIKDVYSSYVKNIFFVSAKENSQIENLKKCLIGKVSAFSGNSGVGKSSIIKNIVGEDYNILVGEIGKKTSKGKHTTKHVKLYEFEKDSYILDTPGFSSYELYDIEYKRLKDYYDEFLDCKCDYDDCTHVLESSDVCEVKRKVENKKIDKSRYERYVYIYNKLKEDYERKYK